MFQVGNTIVSEAILDNEFACNLSACKGACCVDGDSGAPLEEIEVDILKQNYSKIKPYLSTRGQEAINSQGLFVTNDEGGLETPLIGGADCAYAVRGRNKTVHCGIEEAYNQGDIDWKKPISCHLYPIRVTNYTDFSAINYHKWGICDSACHLGRELQLPIYKFVKQALIRKFGHKWYSQLEEVAKKRHIQTPDSRIKKNDD